MENPRRRYGVRALACKIFDQAFARSDRLKPELDTTKRLVCHIEIDSRCDWPFTHISVFSDIRGASRRIVPAVPQSFRTGFFRCSRQARNMPQDRTFGNFSTVGASYTG